MLEQTFTILILQIHHLRFQVQICIEDKTFASQLYNNSMDQSTRLKAKSNTNFHLDSLSDGGWNVTIYEHKYSWCGWPMVIIICILMKYWCCKATCDCVCVCCPTSALDSLTIYEHIHMSFTCNCSLDEESKFEMHDAIIVHNILECIAKLFFHTNAYVIKTFLCFLFNLTFLP